MTNFVVGTVIYAPASAGALFFCLERDTNVTERDTKNLGDKMWDKAIGIDRKGTAEVCQKWRRYWGNFYLSGVRSNRLSYRPAV